MLPRLVQMTRLPVRQRVLPAPVRLHANFDVGHWKASGDTNKTAPATHLFASCSVNLWQLAEL